MQYKSKFTFNQTFVLRMPRNNFLNVSYSNFGYRMAYANIVIAVELVKGLSKSTQIKLLVEKLTKLGYVLYTTLGPSS